MKRFLFSGVVLLALILLVAGLQAQNTIFNDPNAQLRFVKEFHAIVVSDAIDLYLSQGKEEIVVVSARETKWRDRIRTVVEDGVLKISLDKSGFSWSSGNKQLKAYISFTLLDRLKASGASDIRVNGEISGNSLSVELSGASDFKGAVKLNELTLQQSGASDVTITGSVGSLTTIHATGASEVKGYDLVTENCNARVTGASDIRITVNKELNAHATGASSIYYKGDAVIRELHSSGASSISKKN